jgi:alkanesulfonate monooxygenase SsuD/methylene tetrahydromethanopterin reductase-like flavin-dependent oxidoreductase (luciferase family)
MDLSTTSVMIYPQRLERSQLTELVRQVESAGFRALWTADVGSDPLTYAHEILAATDRITAGTCVAVRWKRHPAHLAEVAATIDHLYPGRLVIGLGAAARITDPRAAWGQPIDRPVARMGEYVDIVRAALSDGAVDHKGEFYDVRHQLDFAPGARVRIYTAAGGPMQSRLGARKADGVFFMPNPPWFLSELADQIRSAAVAIDRDVSTLPTHQLVFAFVAETRARARDHIRWGVTNRVLGYPATRRLLADRGYSEVVHSVEQRLDAGDLEGAARLLPDSLVDMFGLALEPADSPDYVETALGALRAPGVTDLILWPYFADRADWAPGYQSAFRLFQELGGQ